MFRRSRGIPSVSSRWPRLASAGPSIKAMAIPARIGEACFVFLRARQALEGRVCVLTPYRWRPLASDFCHSER